MTTRLAVSPAPAVSAEPTSPGDVLRSIRGDGRLRPEIDPGLSGGLRDWLEDGLCSIPLDADARVTVTKQTLRDPLKSGSATEPVTAAMALGALMDALFRQFVTIGRVEEPMQDGLAALAVDQRRSQVVDFIRALSGRELAAFRDELETQTAILVSRWPRLSPAWMPRTQERLAIPLAGGQVVLVGVIDLVVGSPSTGRASVGLIELKSGRPRMADRDDLRFYALLETLRSGAAPFRVATFYSRTGNVDAEDVGDELLACTVERVLAAVAQQAAKR